MRDRSVVIPLVAATAVLMKHRVLCTCAATRDIKALSIQDPNPLGTPGSLWRRYSQIQPLMTQKCVGPVDSTPDSFPTQNRNTCSQNIQ